MITKDDEAVTPPDATICKLQTTNCSAIDDEAVEIAAKKYASTYAEDSDVAFYDELYDAFEAGIAWARNPDVSTNDDDINRNIEAGDVMVLIEALNKIEDPNSAQIDPSRPLYQSYADWELRLIAREALKKWRGE